MLETSREIMPTTTIKTASSSFAELSEPSPGPSPQPEESTEAERGRAEANFSPSASSESSNSSSLESLVSSTSSLSSNRSDSVSVKPVQSFVRKMKADAPVFVSRYCKNQPVTTTGSEVKPTPLETVFATPPSANPPNPGRLSATELPLVASVPVNVNGTIEHVTRYCPDGKDGRTAKIITTKGEYYYTVSTPSSGGSGITASNGETTSKQAEKLSTRGYVSGQVYQTGNGYNCLSHQNNLPTMGGGKGGGVARSNSYHPRRPNLNNKGGGNGNHNHHHSQPKSRHFSGPLPLNRHSPPPPSGGSNIHDNNYYPCSLCAVNFGSNGADLRDGRAARETFLRNRSFSASANLVANADHSPSSFAKGPSTPSTAPISALSPRFPESSSTYQLYKSNAHGGVNSRNLQRSSSSPSGEVGGVMSDESDAAGHTITAGRSAFDMRDPRFDVLTYDQVISLKEVLAQTVTIQTEPGDPASNGADSASSSSSGSSSSSSSTSTTFVSFPLMDLVMAVRERLLSKDVALYDIRLNGGAASHVLSLSATRYNDIDLIFTVDLPSSEQYELVREAVYEVLLRLLPTSGSASGSAHTSGPHTPYHHMKRRGAIEHLVNKMVKIQEPADRWSLISLVNSAGRNVELKFVDVMRRQYEFSVDSFQIVLDTLLAFCTIVSEDEPPITEHFYPTVVGESMYGNFGEAVVHLHNRLIVTRAPEEIRGGGLLKYCSLLVRAFAPADEQTMAALEPYMCARFLIDFIYQDRHRDKLTNYLLTHFDEDSLTKYNFLVVLQATLQGASTLAAHHAEALVIFEELIVETYGQLLAEYFALYASDGGRLQDYVGRCVEARRCRCGPALRKRCVHRQLAQLYAVTAPLVVTYVDDVYSGNGNEQASKDERRANLAHLIDAHDELYPFYGGYTFAFLPSCLFNGDSNNGGCAADEPLPNHYIVSSSTLKSLPPSATSSPFVAPDPPSDDFLCTFLLKTTSSVSQMVKIIPLGVQHLLPKSFFPVELSGELQNLVTPGLASHFFPPVAPPPAYRLCIVNRVPIYHSTSVASGPIYHSAIFAMHANSQPAPPTIPAGVTMEPLYAHLLHHSSYGAPGLQGVSGHFHHLHSHHTHHHHHPHPHHPHHHHHTHNSAPHGSYSLYQPSYPPNNYVISNGGNRSKKASSTNNSYRGNKVNGHQNHHQYQGHYHQHTFHQVPAYQHSMSMPVGHSEVVMMSSSSSSPPAIEPLRIIYPRIPPVEFGQPFLPVSSLPSSSTLITDNSGTNEVFHLDQASLSLPQISINDSPPINLHSPADWPAPGECQTFAPEEGRNVVIQMTMLPSQELKTNPISSEVELNSSYSAAANPNYAYYHQMSKVNKSTNTSPLAKKKLPMAKASFVASTA